MGSTTRFGIVFVAAILFAGSVSFAQSDGAAIYKTKCQSCHGAQGTPNPGIAKAMGVKAVNDPAVKAETAAQMITITTNGKAKMPAFKAQLNEAQIKASIDYFRSLAK